MRMSPPSRPHIRIVAPRCPVCLVFRLEKKRLDGVHGYKCQNMGCHFYLFLSKGGGKSYERA